MPRATLLKRINALCKPIYPQPFSHAIQLKKLSGIKCVALDFYGTMFISGVGDIGVDEQQEANNNHAFKKALTDSSFSINQARAIQTGLSMFSHFIGLHIQKKKKQGIDYPEPDILAVWRNVLQYLLDEDLVQGTLTQESLRRFAIEFEFRVNTIWPVPDLKKVLQVLLDQNLKLGILSNSQFYTPLAFEALIGTSTDTFGFEPSLQKWSYQSGYKKPSLQFYRLFTEELPAQQLKPGEVLYVGNDLFKDIIPAKKQGMKTALYVGDQRSLRHRKADLKPEEQQPDLIIDDLDQLIECI